MVQWTEYSLILNVSLKRIYVVYCILSVLSKEIGAATGFLY